MLFGERNNKAKSTSQLSYAFTSTDVLHYLLFSFNYLKGTGKQSAVFFFLVNGDRKTAILLIILPVTLFRLVLTIYVIEGKCTI